MTGSSGATFVGRELELQELLAAHDVAAAGRGRLMLLAGEPGIGKSRLADELAAAARDRGSRVDWGRCWEDAGAPPYWSWIQVLRAHLRGVEPDAARSMMGAAARDIAQILPELRSTEESVPEARSSESARFQLFDSVATFLARTGEQQPVVIVLDDLHAADTASLMLLRFVASQLGGMRVLMVGTYRDVELTRDHPLTDALAELAREPTTRILTLGGLPPAAVGRIIGAASGVEPHDLLVGAVWRETSGNPLFLGEAVRLLSAEGRLDTVTDLPSLRVSVPAGVRDVILRRVRRVGDEAASLLTLAAGLGPEFRTEVLRRLAGIGQTEAAARLDLSVREGLLAPIVGVLDAHRFAHDLIRETLYAEIGTVERAALHRNVVAVLEELYGATLDDHLGELAYHAFEAVGGVRPDGEAPEESRHLARRAIDYATRAAEHAARSLAYEDAARLYGMALALIGRDDPAVDAERAEVLLRQGDVLARAGMIAASRTALLQAAEIARRIGSGTQLARVALGVGGRLPWARPGSDTVIAPLLQDALVMLGGADDRLRVRLLIRLACVWRSEPERREASGALAGQAVELARSLDDPATLVYALAGLYWATWWPENHESRLALANEMLERAETLGDPERLIDARLMLYMSYVEHGRTGDARRELDVVGRLVEELRQPAQMWLGTAPRTLMVLLEGKLDVAEELLARELQPSPPLTYARDEVSAARLHLFLLRREQGRLDEVEDAARAAVAEFPWYPLHRAALTLILAETGRRAEAAAEFADLARDRFRVVNRDNEWLLTMCLAAECAVVLGDRPTAEVLSEELAPFRGRHAIGLPEGSVGVVDRYFGLLAEVLGRHDEAIEHLRAAVEGNRSLGAVPWLAHSLHELARVLRAGSAGAGVSATAGREAEVLLAEARATAERMGMVALVARIASAPGGDHPHQSEAAPAAVFRREGDYWTVALDGAPARIRDSVGMRYIARLLGDPGREFHALDLVRAATTDGSSGDRTSRARDADAMSLDGGDAGPQLDHEAKAAYRARLAELEQEAAEAESWNDPERAARTRLEIDMLAAELGRAVGLGGRDRRAASAAERARVSATRAIRGAITRATAKCPSVGEHLALTIRTGTYCAYEPDPRAVPRWEL